MLNSRQPSASPVASVFPPPESVRAVSLEAVSSHIIATLMQDFGTLLHFLRQRSHVNQQEVLCSLEHLGCPMVQCEWSRLERGVRAPQFAHLSVIYQALVQSGVEIRAEERGAYLLLAQQRIHAKGTHLEHISLHQWDQLAQTLDAFDAGEPVTVSGGCHA